MLLMLLKYLALFPGLPRKCLQAVHAIIHVHNKCFWGRPGTKPINYERYRNANPRHGCWRMAGCLGAL